MRLMIILTTICALAALSLAKVYEITKEPIANKLREERIKALKAILPPFDNEPDKDAESIALGSNQKNLILYRGYKEGKLTGTALKSIGKGFGGNIEVMVGIEPDGSIYGVEILDHKETPGLGAKIGEAHFKNQFKGRSLFNTKWQVKKDGGDIDQITGATISPRGITKALKNALELYTQYGLQRQKGNKE